jgi:hypothetical protein
MGMNITPRRII